MDLASLTFGTPPKKLRTLSSLLVRLGLSSVRVSNGCSMVWIPRGTSTLWLSKTLLAPGAVLNLQASLQVVTWPLLLAHGAGQGLTLNSVSRGGGTSCKLKFSEGCTWLCRIWQESIKKFHILLRFFALQKKQLSFLNIANGILNLSCFRLIFVQSVTCFIFSCGEITQICTLAYFRKLAAILCWKARTLFTLLYSFTLSTLPCHKYTQ